MRGQSRAASPANHGKDRQAILVRALDGVLEHSELVFGLEVGPAS